MAVTKNYDEKDKLEYNVEGANTTPQETLKEQIKRVNEQNAQSFKVKTNHTPNVPEDNGVTDQPSVAQDTTQLTNSGNYQAALGALTGANGIDGSGDTLQSVYDQIVNRKPFSYNIDEDMMYRQYVDQYTNLGRLAMNDTIGQAAMLTGGYGNSYGQAVGQQQYDAYLQQLNGIIPDLYDRAYQRYMDEGTALQNKYAFMQANPQYAGGSTGGSGGGSLPTTVQNPGLTRDQIIEFQTAFGLTPDGEWGPYTQKMWNKVYGPDFYVDNSGNNTKGNTTGSTTDKSGKTNTDVAGAMSKKLFSTYTTPKTTTSTTGETAGNTSPVMKVHYTYEDQSSALDTYWREKLGLQ